MNMDDLSLENDETRHLAEVATERRQEEDRQPRVTLQCGLLEYDRGISKSAGAL